MEGCINDDFTKISDSTHKRLVEAHTTGGYREGITDGQELLVQDGFNAGYKPGFLNAYSVARLRGILWVLSTQQDCTNTTELNEKLKEAENIITTQQVSSEAESTFDSKLEHLSNEIQQIFISTCKGLGLTDELSQKLLNS